jgi:hypothetical protein
MAKPLPWTEPCRTRENKNEGPGMNTGERLDLGLKAKP